MDAWTDEDRRAFGARLAEARKRRGLSQVDVAAALDLKTKQAVSHWEVGRNTPSAEQLAMLSAEYKVSVSSLLLGAVQLPAQSAMPLTAELMAAIESADGEKRLMIENAARAMLGLPVIPPASGEFGNGTNG